MSKWLVTGGAGYIGAHVVRSLQEAKIQVAVLDDLSTGIEKNIPNQVDFFKGSLLDKSFLERIFNKNLFTGIIHLAAKKSVEESMLNPEYYYEENVGGLLNLINMMNKYRVKKIVYSSSAAVYGETTTSSVDENSPTNPSSPYGETKLIGEFLLAAQQKKQEMNYISLRYFNVVGAANPQLGDTSKNNLLPKVFNKITKNENPFIYGENYDTPDGTCVRDYIDVRDLASAHLSAARFLEDNLESMVLNVGTGEGSSVKQVINLIRNVTGIDFKSQVVERRAGDPAKLVANADLINQKLGWRSQVSLEDSVKSAWKASKLII
jgi:UDP-glucose 4-epimerase